MTSSSAKGHSLQAGWWGMANCNMHAAASLVALSVIFGISPPVTPDVFSSTIKMKVLPGVERILVTALTRYIRALEKDDVRTADKLLRVVNHAREQNEMALADNTYVENPINCFHLLYRFVFTWSRVIKRIRKEPMDNNAKDFSQVVESLKKLPVWPMETDVRGAALGMLRLVEFYELDVRRLASGRIAEAAAAASAPPLGGDELLAIAEQGSAMNMRWEAVRWYNVSIKRFLEDSQVSALVVKAYRHLGNLLFQLGKLKAAARTIQDAIKVDPENPKLLEDLSFFQSAADKQPDEPPPRGRQPPWPYHTVFQNLCRQTSVSSVGPSGPLLPKHNARNPHLRCFYKKTSVPYLRFRTEYRHIHPPVIVFHDVISEREIDWMKRTAFHKLTRSKIGSKGRTTLVEGDIRISQSAWISDDFPTSHRLSKRIELATGLLADEKTEDTNAELYQVINYGFGGVYMPHHDFVHHYRKAGMENMPALKNSGDRIATWIFYLSDVTKGGSTVFPVLQTTVSVTKGSAVFWYNLQRNGKPDDRLLHGGCPVLFGEKWVATKWIREGGQIFTRPCSLNSNL